MEPEFGLNYRTKLKSLFWIKFNAFLVKTVLIIEIFSLLFSGWKVLKGQRYGDLFAHESVGITNSTKW